MSPPWMPLYIGDYLADTAHLRTAEHGAYLLLIMHYWRAGGLPQDDGALARIARMTAAEWRRARPVLVALFDEDWRHKRIEFELTEAARISEAGKRGGIASGEARRRRSADKSKPEANDRSTTVQRSANDQPTNREALQSPSPKKSSEAKASAAHAAPVYTDSKHELFGEGVAILGQLGVKDKPARSNIGRWLKDAKDDAQTVLGAIQRARDHRIVDPIPWVTQAIRTEGNGSRPHRDPKRSGQSDFLAGLAAAAADAAGDDPGPGRTGSEIPRGRIEIDG